MKTKKKYSFSKVIIVQFAIYTFIVLGGYILINIFVNWRLNNSFLVLEDFLKYEDKLKYEDYGGIPMAKFPGCDFAVYDNNNELIVHDYTWQNSFKLFWENPNPFLYRSSYVFLQYYYCGGAK